MKIPFFLVTGFLGSGKTTLLKRFLAEHAGCRRIAVVQNEFADVNVDAAELRRTGKPFHLLEMNKGSVFCVCLLADFTRGCAALINEYEPDAVILEATGLADPIAVAQVLESPDLRDRVYLGHTWAVVDVSTFLKMEPIVRRISHQVRIADTVIVNKTDLAGPGQCDAVCARITAINPHAEVLRVRECDVPLADVFAPAADAAFAVRQADDSGALSAEGRPAVSTAVLRSTRRISRAALDAFLDRFKGGCWRIKGCVQLENLKSVAVQCVLGTVSVVALDGYEGPTELAAIGPGLDAVAFRNAFAGG